MSNIEANIQTIKARMERVAISSDRNPEDIKLLLAVKTVPAETIALALGSDKTLIGENKVQELKAKYDYLSGRNAEFHFIGHLQTNKIKDVIKYADCIQSVDRLDLVQKLDQRLQQEGRNLDIFMQINTSYEESKFGISPESAISLAKEIAKYDTLKVKGLMTIGLFSAEMEKVRPSFRLLKQKQLEIQELGLANFDLKELSMGMSHDFETAIEEGATIVRVGTAIFGDRIYPDSYYWNENKTIK
ncbi:MAG: YggS family pyridoxal phosphate-dependent enzyme [Flavobacterium psychrophilum]|nr:MAG: YggS family pyridoxal phosphate-dependent enzyme [Flavobacterium psychrophilum]